MRDGSLTMTPNEVFLMLRSGLSRLDNNVTAFLHSQGTNPAPDSQAANERAAYSRTESLHTASAIGQILLESVGEHVTVLIRAMTEPITPFVCWTLVRSMLESASIAAWLFDPMIDAHERVGRAYSHRYVGLVEQVKFGRAASLPVAELKQLEDLLDKLECDAVSLAFPIVRDRNNKRIGIAVQMPTATDIIKQMLNEECAYRILSAVAHGHTWAMLPLGYTQAAMQHQQTQHGFGTTTMEKSAGSIHMQAYSIVRATQALSLPVWNMCQYFGWDKVQLANILESVYDEMKILPAFRFWL